MAGLHLAGGEGEAAGCEEGFAALGAPDCIVGGFNADEPALVVGCYALHICDGCVESGGIVGFGPVGGVEVAAGGAAFEGGHVLPAFTFAAEDLMAVGFLELGPNI